MREGNRAGTTPWGGGTSRGARERKAPGPRPLASAPRPHASPSAPRPSRDLEIRISPARLQEVDQAQAVRAVGEEEVHPLVDVLDVGALGGGLLIR